MARRSLESQRPIMAPSLVASNRSSKRYSTISLCPSYNSTAGSALLYGEPGMAEIRQLTQGLDRLENKQLNKQRFVPSQQKTDEISKLSLGAKVERALGRRLTDQDADYKYPSSSGDGNNAKRKNSNQSSGSDTMMESGMEVYNEKTAIQA